MATLAKAGKRVQNGDPTPKKWEVAAMLIINACVFCGKKSEGHYSIHRDGTLNGDSPQVPLCDVCGDECGPSAQQIWARISMIDDYGGLWGPTIVECQQEKS